ncbi:MAG: pyridoxal-dependent decarboxylase, exosortase A system-associated [Myxococcota bacterium]|nr:pyridoxal-dependent decarboxylase, exosortase A system-associated [Myxococcota bacterium]
MDKTDIGWEDVPIFDVASESATPFYIFDATKIRDRVQGLRDAFPKVELLYALKANPNLEIISLMNRETLVDGLDIASEGELKLALRAGFEPQSLSLAGPAKTDGLLRAAIQSGVGCICVESRLELEKIFSMGLSRSTQLMLRINPSEPIHAFQMKISGRPTPFGIDEEELDGILGFWASHEYKSSFAGVHVHAGSQCFSAGAWARHIQKVFALAEYVSSFGLTVSTVNMGGGFGVSTWEPHVEASPKSIAGQLIRLRSKFSSAAVVRFELGRYIMAPAGAFVTRVVSKKTSRGEKFLMLDGGTHQLFSARHVGYQSRDILVDNLSNPTGALESWQMCGPLCTPEDRLGGRIDIHAPRIGDLLLFRNTGAYGLTMSPMFFLGHPTPKEILYDRGRWRTIRESFSADCFWKASEV